MDVLISARDRPAAPPFPEGLIHVLSGILLTGCLLFGGCGAAYQTGGDTSVEGSIPMSIELRSEAFAPGEPIPRRYTGDGEDLSPPLAWTEVPADAVELVLIVDDPDAPRAEPWVHWVVYSVPANLGGMPEGISRDTFALEAAGGLVEGGNDFGRLGYGGPAPPRGHGVHRYQFKLYALDAPLNLAAGAGKKQAMQAMSGHVLAQGLLVGTYER